jgi:hypothetical protein
MGPQIATQFPYDSALIQSNVEAYAVDPVSIFPGCKGSFAYSKRLPCLQEPCMGETRQINYCITVTSRLALQSRLKRSNDVPGSVSIFPGCKGSFAYSKRLPCLQETAERLWRVSEELSR